MRVRLGVGLLAAIALAPLLRELRLEVSPRTGPMRRGASGHGPVRRDGGPRGAEQGERRWRCGRVKESHEKKVGLTVVVVARAPLRAGNERRSPGTGEGRERRSRKEHGGPRSRRSEFLADDAGFFGPEGSNARKAAWRGRKPLVESRQPVPWDPERSRCWTRAPSPSARAGEAARRYEPGSFTRSAREQDGRGGRVAREARSQGDVEGTDVPAAPGGAGDQPGAGPWRARACVAVRVGV